MSTSPLKKSGALSAAAIALSKSAVQHEDVRRRGDSPQGVYSAQDRERFVKAISSAPLKPVQRLIGIALIGFLNFQSRQCNPSFETLGKAVNMTDRSVKTHVKALEAAGWIKVHSTRGRNSNQYELRIPTVKDFPG